MTPCKSASDFLPDAYSYAWCDLSASNVSKETCDAAEDCKEDWETHRDWCRSALVNLVTCKVVPQFVS